MGGVGSGARESVALDGFRDPVGKADLVSKRIAFGLQPRLHGVNAPGNAGWIATIHRERIETVQAQVPVEPAFAALLGDLATLLDAPTVEDDDRADKSTVFGAPPAWRPVAAALLLEGAIAEERDQALAHEWRMNVLQLGEAEVAAFQHATGGVRVDVRAERRGWSAVGIEGVGVEVADEAAQAGIGAVVA